MSGPKIDLSVLADWPKARELEEKALLEQALEASKKLDAALEDLGAPPEPEPDDPSAEAQRRLLGAKLARKAAEIALACEDWANDTNDCHFCGFHIVVFTDPTTGKKGYRHEHDADCPLEAYRKLCPGEDPKKASDLVEELVSRPLLVSTRDEAALSPKEILVCRTCGSLLRIPPNVFRAYDDHFLVSGCPACANIVSNWEVVVESRDAARIRGAPQVPSQPQIQLGGVKFPPNSLGIAVGKRWR